VVPWGTCDNWWNTKTCVSAYTRDNLTAITTEDNRTLYNLNGTMYEAMNLTDPVKEYWE
jgi:solute carrier family 6 (neurotransmitter transporter, GABA) member 1